MTKIEKRILKDIYESVDGLSPYTFYSRYKIKPSETFKFVEKYESKGIIKSDDDRITTTEEGRNIILKQIFYNKSAGIGKYDIPKEFLVNKIDINEPYLPNIREVSKEILS